ncbi:uncharacterized protein BJX67DRAFT_107967 [Aspergillus lucknowensis]|uniref:Uncharacterized protein n=1 Tax=Aspergillus lucknowensis TaxID=176173 RepID=A0ABR4LRW7_9EURO
MKGADPKESEICQKGENGKAKKRKLDEWSWKHIRSRARAICPGSKRERRSSKALDGSLSAQSFCKSATNSCPKLPHGRDGQNDWILVWLMERTKDLPFPAPGMFRGTGSPASRTGIVSPLDPGVILVNDKKAEKPQKDAKVGPSTEHRCWTNIIELLRLFLPPERVDSGSRNESFTAASCPKFEKAAAACCSFAILH